MRPFPFFVADSVGVSKNSRILHWHNDMEICYIKQGVGKYLINGHEYVYEAGDVFLINNDEIHLAFDDHGLIMQVVLFDPSMLWSGGSFVLDYEYLLPFIESGSKYGHKLPHDHPHIGEVIDILLEIQKEYEMKQPRYELMIKSMLLKLMTVTIRFFGTEEGRHETVSPVHSQKLKYAAEYMEKNFHKPVNIEEMAVSMDISVSHFYKLFRKFSGIPPMEYLTCRRICAAKDMLKSTDKKILDIAAECGFNSLSSFNKNFKAHTGVSPSAYRKE